MDRLFETNTLTRVVNDLRVPVHGFLMMLFDMVLQFEEEKVYFDRTRPDQGLMPASLPTVQAPVTQEKSYDTESFTPGYRKHKTPCDINRPFRRAAGEQISGSTTPRERARMAVAENLAMHKMMFYNLLEYQSAQTLVHGGYAMVGEQYPLRIIDFNRPASQIVTLTGADRWSESGSNPSDDFIDWAEAGAKNGAGMLDTAIMGNGAFKVFRSHPDVVEKFDWASNMRNQSDIDTGAQFDRGLKYRGMYDGVSVFTYQDWYKSDGYHYIRNASGALVHDTNVEAGSVQPFIPSGSVILVDTMNFGGTRAFGAIRDEHFINGMTALPMATRSWVEKDPGQRFLLTQSAPVIFPYRIESSLHATVI